MLMAGFDLGICLRQVRLRDEEAAHALVDHLYPLVIRIVRSHLPRRMAEEDLAQEVFLRLFSRIDQYEMRDGTPFEHWVARLSVRTCLDALRAEKRRPELRWADLSEDQAAWLEHLLSDDPTEPETESASARELVERLLQSLPAEGQLVIRMLDLEQRSVQEISQLTGWSATLVKVRAFRARHKLKKAALELQKMAKHEQF